MIFPQIRYHSAWISIGVNQHKQSKSLSIKISEDLKRVKASWLQRALSSLVGYYRNRPAGIVRSHVPAGCGDSWSAEMTSLWTSVVITSLQ